MVLIMGWAANVHWWPASFLDLLAKEFTLFFFDNRGAGKTRGDSLCFSMPQAAQDTLGFMDALGIESAHVFGISMGGMIAQQMALVAPHRVNSLILGCTSAFPRQGFGLSFGLLRFLWRYLKSPRVRRRHWVANMLFTHGFLEENQWVEDEFVRRRSLFAISREAYHNQFRAILKFNLRSQLNNIQQKTLVITGVHDFLVPVRHSRFLAKKIPNAQYVVLENASHGFIAEADVQAAESILKFLA